VVVDAIASLPFAHASPARNANGHHANCSRHLLLFLAALDIDCASGQAAWQP
jgi:hypothetical protein